MERNFDEINEIFSTMSEEDYKESEVAANEYYSYGYTDRLERFSEKSGLTAEEILSWW